MMTDVLRLSLKELRNLIRSGELSPLTITLEMLNHVKEYKSLNSYITLTDELSMDQAKASTERVVNNNIQALEGIPIAVKDIFVTKNITTTAGSKILENFVPKYESSVTDKLWKSGAIMIGKTNMDEFAMGSSNQTSHFGPVSNPWNCKHVPGGSSGGSAAAVASYCCYAALGSDTGGSVRQPASFCGVVGIKPSYGRCSRFGMIAYSSSLDQAGVIARSVEDACIVLDQIIGPCVNDSTTVDRKLQNLESVSGSVKGKKIGYIPAHMDLVSSCVKEVWKNSIEILRQNGANLIEIDVNELGNNPIEKWMAIYYVLTPVEAFSNLCRYDGIRYGSYTTGKDLQDAYKNTRSQFGDEVKRRIMLGADILSTENDLGMYSKALHNRSIIKKQFTNIFNKVDAILSPTSPNEAFELGSINSAVDMYAEDAFTIIANLLGAPAISIPAGLGHKNLPIGMQIMSAPFEEVKMIEIAKVLELGFDFKKLNEVSK